jgi:hypothetical protein
MDFVIAGLDVGDEVMITSVASHSGILDAKFGISERSWGLSTLLFIGSREG